jgi:hypothetical protein
MFRAIAVAGLLALWSTNTPAAKPGTGLVGHWHGQMQGAPAELQLRADGNGSFNGEVLQYQMLGNQLLVSLGGALNAYLFELKGNTLTIAGGDLAAPLRLTRAAPSATSNKSRGGTETAQSAGGGDLAGKWCYIGAFSALSGGGRMTSECFVLHPNGTYEYAAESSMSAYAPGMWGGTASQSSDRGRWSATGTTLTAHSQSGKVSSYRLARRNHPKNKRDPMLCLDERCYVTYYQRAPW